MNQLQSAGWIEPRNLRSLPCRLLYRSTGPHLQQLYTGFLLLHQAGCIRLTQELRHTACRYANDTPHLRDAGHAHLDVVLDGNIRIHFDTHDSREIAVGELEDCDVYFKRSWLQSEVDALPTSQRHKVLPLGLNYRVLPDTVDPFAVRRSTQRGFSRHTFSGIKQAVDGSNRWGFQPRLAQMSAPPPANLPPQVLFLAATYDPDDDPARAPDKVAERGATNKFRAECLRLLKSTLGSSFLGGFSPSAYALEHYPDLVVSGEFTDQINYLRLLQSYPICIATTGLHGSTGWKFAEYVAFARAILSEPLTYTVPGPFAAGHNYLQFTSAQQCVQNALRLIEQPALRQQLMYNNAEYYRSHLKPDAMVKNALLRSLDLTGR